MPIKSIVSSIIELKKPCEEVIKKDNYQAIITDLKDTLIAHPSGLGLSANQICYNKRISYLRIPKSKTEFDEYVLINPKITEKIGKASSFKEGCLSFPGISVITSRYITVAVEYYDENFEKLFGIFDGLKAIVLQHEYSHLCGRVLFDDKWRAR
jgi:peptide deformylase